VKALAPPSKRQSLLAISDPTQDTGSAQQGERALQTPYDDRRGTPKSWTNPADAEPDNEDGIKRLGKRVIEEGVIEPCEDKED
jgi:hypothetical protein